MAKVATQLKWGKTLPFEKQIAFSTFLSVATYVFGALSIVPSLRTEYFVENERLKLIINNFTIILERVKPGTVDYQSPLTTDKFREWKSMREAYEYSQTRLQKPLYDLLQKARVWYNTRDAYKTGLETNYLEKADYLERRIDEVNELIAFCKQSESQACKTTLPILDSTLDKYKEIHSSLEKIKLRLDKFDSSGLEEDKLIKEYRALDTELKDIIVPEFKKDEIFQPVLRSVRAKVELVSTNLQKLRNLLDYWKTTNAFLLLQSVHQNYTNLKQILPRSINTGVSEKDYKNINDIFREIDSFLELNNRVDVSNAHEIQEQIDRYDEQINKNIRIPLLDHSEMYSKTLTELATFEKQHPQLVEQNDQLLASINQLKNNIPDLGAFADQLKTVEYLVDSKLKDRNVIEQGQRLLSEFKKLKTSVTTTTNIKTITTSPDREKREGDIQSQIDSNKAKESQLSMLLSDYNMWKGSYEMIIEESHRQKVSSLKTLQNTYANQFAKLFVELDDSKKWLSAYSKRPGIEQYIPDIKKLLEEIDQLKNELNELIQSIRINPNDKTNVLSESDLSKLTTSFVNRAEKLKKDIQKTTVSIRDFTLRMEKNLSNAEKPPESRVWESPVGQIWAQTMDRWFKDTHMLKDTDMLKRNIVPIAGAIGLTAVVYYLYWKGKRYYKQKKLIQRIESLKPKLMWTVIQPYASDTLRPVNVSPTSNNIYEKVVDVIEKSLRPSTQPVLKKITSKTSRPSYGVQILMSQEVVPDVQVYLLDELKRKGLTNDSLIKAAPKSSSRVVLPILV
jgi:hypothetical protein